MINGVGGGGSVDNAGGGGVDNAGAGAGDGKVIAERVGGSTVTCTDSTVLIGEAA